MTNPVFHYFCGLYSIRRGVTVFMLTVIKKSIATGLLISASLLSYSQCATPVSAFPYTEGFEASNGGWTAGGTGSDWAWGVPAKPVINTAGQGTKCWVVGGLTGASYTDGEASWLQSPCFDFSTLDYPYISMKVFWEMEQQFDGASFQYSINNGGTWTTLGNVNVPANCLNTNWYNQGSINYLSPLTSTRQGWSGNTKSSSGSCRGGGGSNGWKTATHIMPDLAGRPAVIFRFIFGAGTICNNYDGFAIDEIIIGDAPPNEANFTFTCAPDEKTVNFTSTSTPCPTTYSWDFDDPASGTANSSGLRTPSHTFSGPGVYTVSLTASADGNAPSTITKDVTILSVNASLVTEAKCETNLGGAVMATATGTTAPINYTWNSSPAQTGATATNLPSGNYIVTAASADACNATATVAVPLDNSCTGIYFPSAFSPGSSIGANTGFGALGGIGAITKYRLGVYNRWGQMVFETTNPAAKWYGNYKGVKQDSNLFVWQAEYITQQSNEVQKRKGTVLLIR